MEIGFLDQPALVDDAQPGRCFRNLAQKMTGQQDRDAVLFDKFLQQRPCLGDARRVQPVGVGSSRGTTSGRWISVLARPSRCQLPCDNTPAFLCR